MTCGWRLCLPPSWGYFPSGFVVEQNGSITPAELAMGIILSLSIVGPLMKATTFINEAKSMEYAVEAANELLNLPILPVPGKIAPIKHKDMFYRCDLFL